MAVERTRGSKHYLIIGSLGKGSAGCFSAWGKRILLFYRGHEKRNSFGVSTLTTEYHTGSEITLELNLILCRLTWEALPVSATLRLFRSE